MCLTLCSTQIYVESHLSNTATKFYGELTQQMIKMGDSPGSDNGTGTDAACETSFEWTRSSRRRQRDAAPPRSRRRVARESRGRILPSFHAGFFQTLASLKIREFYEKLSGVEVEVEAPAKVAA